MPDRPHHRERRRRAARRGRLRVVRRPHADALGLKAGARRAARAAAFTIHESAAQVTQVTHGIPWLGFIVYPTYRRVKGRNVRAATRRLHARVDDYRAGRITFGELDASVQGWINHVRYADTWGLRTYLFQQPWFDLRHTKRDGFKKSPAGAARPPEDSGSMTQ